MTASKRGRDLARDLLRRARRQASAGNTTAAATYAWLADVVENAAREAERRDGRADADPGTRENDR